MHDKEIILANPSGFCFGVERAVEIARKAAKESGAAVTLGPLVHNAQVVESLKGEGVVPVASLPEATARAVIIPSHGLSPAAIREIQTRGLDIVDATCPIVKRSQEIVRDLSDQGYDIIIIGEQEHSEVKALLGWAKGTARVVKVPDDVPSGDTLGARVGVVVQTTEKEEVFRSVIARIFENMTQAGRELRIFNTRCRATEERQSAAMELAGSVDAMIVIGSSSSANTRRLVEVSEKNGTPTYLVETLSDLANLPLRNFKTLGVTAGASTPNWVIEEVLQGMSEMMDAREELKEDTNPAGDNGAAGQAAEGAPAAEEKEPDAADKTPIKEPSGAEGGPNGQSQPEGNAGEAARALSGEGGPSFNPGDIIKGTVVSIEDKQVLVDIGYKSEGIIPISEMSRKRVQDPKELFSIGDEVEVMVQKVEDDEGNVILSKRKADQERTWQRLETALANGEILEGTVTEVVKGGVSVDVGVRGFVPASQVAQRPMHDLTPLVGTTMRLKVLEADRSKRNVVLSARQAIEEDMARAKEEKFATLTEGDIVDGIIKRVVDFGAFVDIGNGVEGLLHISDMSWGRGKNPRDIVSPGDTIKVKVLNVDRERERISLGLKQTLPDPWDNVEEKYPVGAVVKGKVTKLMEFGAFVELEDGVEGLVHISQLADRHVSKPSEVVEPGQEVEVKVVGIRPEERRISLSMREAQGKAKREKTSEAKSGAREERAKQHPEPQGPTLGDVFGEELEGFLKKNGKES